MLKSTRREKIVAPIQRPAHSDPRENSRPDLSETSMLGFYANRASRCLSATERAALEKAKAALQLRQDATANSERNGAKPVSARKP